MAFFHERGGLFLMKEVILYSKWPMPPLQRLLPDAPPLLNSPRGVCASVQTSVWEVGYRTTLFMKKTPTPLGPH